MDALASLTEINLDDLVVSFGWQDRPCLSRILRCVFFGAARRFARQMIDFDLAVGAYGLPHASRKMLGQFAREVRIFAHPLPEGPFLALSNHPGIADTLALFASLKRPDLKIIAIDRPFLQALPNISQRLFYVTEDPAMRMALLRRVSGHLRSGGAALTFPAGQIEPDPDVYPGAIEALERWTESAGVFLRMAPETAILPVLVRGVIWKRTANHPLTHLKKNRQDKEKLAAALQLLAHVMWNAKPVSVRIQVGIPLTVKSLGTTQGKAIHQAVLQEMRRLVQTPPAGEGMCVL